MGLFATPGGIAGDAWPGSTVAGHSDVVHVTQYALPIRHDTDHSFGGAST